jgi:hypothetical protein
VIDFSIPLRTKEDYHLRVILEQEPQLQPQPQPKGKRGPKKRVKSGSGDLMKLRLNLTIMPIQILIWDIKSIYKTI